MARPEYSMNIADLRHYERVAGLVITDEIRAAADAHLELVNRYNAAEDAVEEAKNALRAAEAADAAAIVRAIEEDKPIKAPNLEPARAELARREQILAAFSGPLSRSAYVVAQAIEAARPAMVDSADAWVHRTVDEVKAAEAQLAQLKAKLGEATSLRSWCQSADNRGGLSAGGRLKSAGRAPLRRGPIPVPSEQDAA